MAHDRNCVPAGRSHVGERQPGYQAAALCAVVVEDEFLVRWEISEVLRERGFDVYEFATADEAWVHIQSSGRVDLVFTDIRLPGTLNGLELVKLIRDGDLPIKAVVVTSSHIPVAAHPPPALFVPKPYDPEKTAALLLKLTNGEE